MEKELDAILAKLDAKQQRKREINLAKAQAEIQTINREYKAYYDGVYDALKEVKALLANTAAAEKEG